MPSVGVFMVYTVIAALDPHTVSGRFLEFSKTYENRGMLI
jgi:hypothetical protein